MLRSLPDLICFSFGNLYIVVRDHSDYSAALLIKKCLCYLKIQDNFVNPSSFSCLFLFHVLSDRSV